jgi:hypothetical protein
VTPHAGALADAFEHRTLDPASFGHRAHVAVAFEMLDRYPFLAAATAYSDGIRALAAAAGAPEKFNLTMTLAFISLIAERKAAGASDTFDAFERHNGDLFCADALRPWYTDARLQSDAARELFLMPDRIEPPLPQH